MNKFIIQLDGEYICDPYFSKDKLTSEINDAWIFPQELIRYVIEEHGGRAIPVNVTINEKKARPVPKKDSHPKIRTAKQGKH